MITNLHPEVRELIVEGGHMEAFEKGELTLIHPIIPTDSMSENDFDAIGINDGGGVYAFKEADPSQPPLLNPILMNSKRWNLMKSRKQLSLDFLENQGMLSRRSENEGGKITPGGGK